MTNPTYIVNLEVAPNSFQDVSVWCTELGYSNHLFTPPNFGAVGYGFVTLDNWAGQFTPTSSASPYYPNLRPRARVRFAATYGGSTFNLFEGYATSFALDPSFEGRFLTIELSDKMAFLRDATVTTSLRLNTNPGSALAEVFSLTGVTSWYSEVLAETMPFQWFDGHDALNAFKDLLGFGGYFGWVDGSGVIQVRDRFWDIRGSVVASYSSALALPYQFNSDELFNYVEVNGAQYEVGSAGTVVAALLDPQLVPAGRSISFWLNYQEPTTLAEALAADLIFPVASVDYMGDTTSAGNGSDMTVSLSLTCNFFGRSVFTRVHNGDTNDVWLTQYQVRGTPLVSRSPLTAVSENTSSQALYDVQKLVWQNRFLTDREFMSNYADFLLYRYQEPVPRLGLTARNDFPTTLAAAPGNRVHLVNSYLDVGSSFTIVALEHRVTIVNQMHTTKFTLDGLRPGQNVLILDDVELGVLDQRVYGF